MKNLFLLGAIALCAHLAAPRIEAKDAWRTMQTKNFKLVGNADESDIRKVATKLEQFRMAITVMLPAIKLDTPVPTTVVVLRDDEAFKPFKPMFKGKTQQDVGGYFTRHPDMNYIVLTADDRFDTFHIIFHEYWHYIIRNNLGDVPLWLNEGMAEFYSTFDTSEGGAKAVIGNPIDYHIGELRDKPFMPLQTLLAVNHSSPEYNESSKAGIFYAESWALVHYLMIGDQRKHLPELVSFLDGLTSGLSLQENFEKSFHVDYKTFEANLRQYISKFTFPILNATFADKLVEDKAFTATKLSDAETEYYEGELDDNVGRYTDAEKHLRGAIAADDKFGAAYVSLGQNLLSQKHPAEAKQAFQTAVSVTPQNYLGYYYLGNFLMAERNTEEALNAYKQALAAAPKASIVYLGLAYAYEGSGKDEDAISQFSLATQLDPHNSDTYRGLSFALLRVGRGQYAANAAMNYLRIEGWQDDSSSYLVLSAYFGRLQSHQNDLAAKLLNDAQSKLNATDWPAPVFRYLRKQITADELLALATDKNKMTEARCYLGFDLSLSGKTTDAQPHLQWVADNGNKNFVEYGLALSELKRIAAKAAPAVP